MFDVPTKTRIDGVTRTVSYVAFTLLRRANPDEPAFVRHNEKGEMTVTTRREFAELFTPNHPDPIAYVTAVVEDETLVFNIYMHIENGEFRFVSSMIEMNRIYEMISYDDIAAMTEEMSARHQTCKDVPEMAPFLAYVS